ncbi:hypothetical protein EMIT0P201_130001 [Pseudomonas chlororaphis]
MVRNNPVINRDIDGRILECCTGGAKRVDSNSLKGKGPFTIKTESDVAVSFSFSRNDSEKAFDPISKMELRDTHRQGVLETSTGDQMTSYNSGSKWYTGTAWDKSPLTDETDIIVLHNGRQGAAGLKIELDNIESGHSVLITGGTLSGCTMITGIKGSTFYALHAGTGTPSEQWKTGREGVRDNIMLYNRLNPEDSIDIPSEFNNNQLTDLLGHFDKGTLAYSGKDPFKIVGEEEGSNIFNYSKTGVGVSFTLIKKNAQGVASVETMLELGDLSLFSPHKTKLPPVRMAGEVPVKQAAVSLLKYKSIASTVHKLL